MSSTHFQCSTLSLHSDDETRVQLNEGPDYVNANKVDLEIYTTGQINHYIAAQGPMQHTCKDFWQVSIYCTNWWRAW